MFNLVIRRKNMKKIALVSALTMLFAHNAGAVPPPTIEPEDPGNVSGDIDCVKYTAEEAKAATSDSNSNSFSAVFSHAAGRKASTNKDCKSGSSSSGSVGDHSGGTND